MNNLFILFTTLESKDLASIFVDSHQFRPNFFFIVEFNDEEEYFREFYHLVIDVVQLQEVKEVAVVEVYLRKFGFYDFLRDLFVFIVAVWVEVVVGVEEKEVFGHGFMEIVRNYVVFIELYHI